MSTTHTHGPVAWQKFGDEYYLTGQYGMRPIILSVGFVGKSTRHKSLKLLSDGLLVDFRPDHPDAKFIVQAWNGFDDLLQACKAALDCITPTGDDTKSDRAIVQIEAAIKKAEKGVA